jgi:hypothetical protein
MRVLVFHDVAGAGGRRIDYVRERSAGCKSLTKETDDLSLAMTTTLGAQPMGDLWLPSI